MSSINSLVTLSNSDLEGSQQFEHSSCAFPPPHWLSKVSIFNSEWLGLCWGYTSTALNGKVHSPLYQYQRINGGCWSKNAQG